VTPFIALQDAAQVFCARTFDFRQGCDKRLANTGTRDSGYGRQVQSQSCLKCGEGTSLSISPQSPAPPGSGCLATCNNVRLARK